MNVLKLTTENQKQIIDEVVRCLQKNQVVILPFDTVYGFISSAKNDEAVLEIFKLKERPLTETIGVAVSNFNDLKAIANLTKDNEIFIKDKIPGKYTFILNYNSQKGISNFCIKKDTIGIRIPDSKFILNIIKDFSDVVTQTSANKSGMPNCFSIDDILAQYNPIALDDVALIVDGGTIKESSPSKIFDLTKKEILTIRN